MRKCILLLVSVMGFLSASAQTPVKQPTADGKIGYVDVDNVILQLPEYKQLETKLQETQKRLSDELLTKRQDFERLYTDYMRNGKTMPDSSRVKAEENLQRMDAEIQQFQADAQNTFENTKKLFLGPVYLKLGGVIRDVAIENGFSMILPYRVGNSELLIHTDTKLDVSDLVLKKFTSN
jgi:outer membrane protein